MIQFVLNIKNIIANKTINEFTSTLFKLTINEIDILGGDKSNSKITYEVKKRPYLTEFNFEIIFFVPESICLNSEVYNELTVALYLSKLIEDEVLIHDQTNDPYRWILIKSQEEIYLADELISENTNDIGFIIDRRSLKKIPIKFALSALPDKNYVLLEEESRPIFYNKLKNWG